MFCSNKIVLANLLIVSLASKIYKVEYTPGERKAGISKNNLFSLYDLGINGLISNSIIPIRFASYFSLSVVCKSEVTFCRCCILLTATEYHLPVSKKDVSDVCEVSPVTVNKIHKKLLEHIGDLLPPQQFINKIADDTVEFELKMNVYDLS